MNDLKTLIQEAAEDRVSLQDLTNEIKEFIEDKWDDVWETYGKFFESSIPLDIQSLKDNLNIKLCIEPESDNSIFEDIGRVEFNPKTLNIKITFNEILAYFKIEAVYSSITHEMCHLATLFKEISSKTFNYAEYKACGGHDETWTNMVSKFNKLKGKNGKPFFNIKKSYTPEEKTSMFEEA